MGKARGAASIARVEARHVSTWTSISEAIAIGTLCSQSLDLLLIRFVYTELESVDWIVATYAGQDWCKRSRWTDKNSEHP